MNPTNPNQTILNDHNFDPNMPDTLIERCDLHIRKNKELRDRKVHDNPRQDLMEHLWNLKN